MNNETQKTQNRTPSAAPEPGLFEFLRNDDAELCAYLYHHGDVIPLMLQVDIRKRLRALEAHRLPFPLAAACAQMLYARRARCFGLTPKNLAEYPNLGLPKAFLAALEEAMQGLLAKACTTTDCVLVVREVVKQHNRRYAYQRSAQGQGSAS
jgi:hypothetical protein